MKRHSYFLISGFLLFLLFFFIITNKNTHSQQIPPPPPVPVPLVPSIVEDIRNTKHNLSSIGPAGRNIYTEQTTEICVFCHTPHGASVDAASQINAPIWNRNLSTARYILYDQIWSTSFEGFEVNPPKPNTPTGYSRLCLSCHDGTIAISTIINTPGSGTSYVPFNMIYPTGQSSAGGSGTMPVGSGIITGDTRVIGTNLQNDHPISFIYDSALAMRDEELVDPGPPLLHPAKVNDPTPISPLRRYPGADLNKFDSVQCTSCHNPHAATYPKFMRASFFNNDPADTNYPSASKIICLYCHDKPGWTGSSHDLDTFVPPPTPTSGNPYNYDGVHTVGQYACRACHDPHTAQGAKRLLREGVDYNNNFAIENTCFLCHKPASELGNPANPPPDIRSEFYKDANLGMGGSGSAMNVKMDPGHEPVFVGRPQEGVELWSPSPPPFNEYSPGSTIQDTVHVECVDCHNPHQVTRTNRLKGMKGIDINGNVVGVKIPGNSREPYVYEVCLRCHGNSYTNLFAGNRFPDDTNYRSDPRDAGPTNPNFSLRGYSNKRKEFDPNTADVAPDHSQQSKNSAFHPVAAAGRNGTRQLCKQLAVAFNIYESSVNPGGTNGSCNADPAGALKNITIQCTDCHNNNTTGIGDVKGPVTGMPDGSSYRRITDLPSNISDLTSNDASKPQGPHGSAFIRILRNNYNTDIGRDMITNLTCGVINTAGRDYCADGKISSHTDKFKLCFQCHDQRAFDSNLSGANPSDASWTNFFGNYTIESPWDYNLHMYHLRLSGAYCHECHNNVHSNVEAVNTIYGDGSGRAWPDCGAGSPGNPSGNPLTDPPGCLPPDNEDGMIDGIVDTHLINFAPSIVTGATAVKPRWYYTFFDLYGVTYKLFRCDLKCHQTNMSTCAYRPDPPYYKINRPDGKWCAGASAW
ncbi:MAG: hypothetical protein HZA08_04465 [Nitrospirae bacterium]|nr:hypothetical protein [Nitrospirota bacterium]